MPVIPTPLDRAAPRGRAAWVACVALVAGVACARDQAPPASHGPPRKAISVAAVADTDDFGAPLPVDARHAARVVSLNPAATEAIFALGAQARLVGRSRWDTFPADASRVPPLGDGIRPNVEAVLAARPTLVILYATAENRAAADAFARAGVRTLALRVDRIPQFYALLRTLGVALGASSAAQVVADSVRGTLAAVRARTATRAPVRVAWPLWERPLLVVGGGSYLDELLTVAGGSNVFHDMDAPSPPVSLEELARRNPDALVVGEARAQRWRDAASWRAVSAVRAGRFVTVNTELTGRPSVNLGMAAVALARALHPALADSLP